MENNFGEQMLSTVWVLPTRTNLFCPAILIQQVLCSYAIWFSQTRVADVIFKASCNY